MLHSFFLDQGFVPLDFPDIMLNEATNNAYQKIGFGRRTRKRTQVLLHTSHRCQMSKKKEISSIRKRHCQIEKKIHGLLHVIDTSIMPMVMSHSWQN